MVSALFPGCIAESPLFREKRGWFRAGFPVFQKFVTKQLVSVEVRRKEVNQRASALKQQSGGGGGGSSVPSPCVFLLGSTAANADTESNSENHGNEAVLARRLAGTAVARSRKSLLTVLCRCIERKKKERVRHVRPKAGQTFRRTLLLF